MDGVAALREVLLAGDHYRQVLANFLGLTVSESQAVSYLYARGALGQSELGALLGFTNTSSMTALIDRLERNQYAVRVPHPTDRRRATIRLTERGHAAVRVTVQWFVRAFDSTEREVLPQLTESLLTIARDLRAAVAHLPGGAGTPGPDPAV